MSILKQICDPSYLRMNLIRSKWDLIAIAGLIVLVLTFFPVFFPLQPSKALIGYDPVYYFYPYRHEAVEALKEGRVPLWNPYMFMGAPFLANIQAGVFYPLNLLFAFSNIYQSAGYLTVVHVLIAAVGLYLLERAILGVHPYAAFLAAFPFALGGFFSWHAGHVNQIAAACWLPWLFLFYHQAVNARRRCVFVLLGGCVVALQILAGHTQEAYYSFVALGLYGLFLSVRSWRHSWKRGMFSLLVGVGVFVIGCGLAAIQLFPTFELSQLSYRGTIWSLEKAAGWPVEPRALLDSLMPGYWGAPYVEIVGYIGGAALVLAAGGFWLNRRHPSAIFFGGLCFLGLVLAMGTHTPLYAILYRIVPGFSMFRVAGRWLLIYTFGASILVGLGLHSALEMNTASCEIRSSSMRSLFLFASVDILILALVLVPYFIRTDWPIVLPASRTIVVWCGVLLLSIFLYGLLLTMPLRRLWIPQVGFAILVVGELWGASRIAEYNHSMPLSMFDLSSGAVEFLHQKQKVFRSFFHARWEFVDLPGQDITRQQLQGILSDQDIASYLRYRQTLIALKPNLSLIHRLESIDGYDGGLLPTERYVRFKGLYIPEEQIVPDLTLSDQIPQFDQAKQMGMYNVKYIYANHDQSLINILSNSFVLGPGDHFVLDKPDGQNWDGVSALSIVSWMSDAVEVFDQSVVARVNIVDWEGHEQVWELRAGQETAEWAIGRAEVASLARHQKPPMIAGSWGEQGEGFLYRAYHAFAQPVSIQRIEFDYVADLGQLHIQKVELTDRNLGYNLVYDDDQVAIYEDPDALPRSYLVYNTECVSDQQTALEKIQLAAWDPTRRAIVEANPAQKDICLSSGGDLAMRAVEIQNYQPEYVKIKAVTDQQAALILNDSFYPGWKAYLDGRPVPIWPANILVRAVAIPPGEHIVEFVYRPVSYQVGMWTTLSFLGLIFVGLVFALVKRNSE